MARITIDFTNSALQYRRLHGGGLQQDLARACGLHKGLRKLLDATAGYGEDAFILASLGATVTAIERHPEVSNALTLALEQAKNCEEISSIAKRITLISGNAIELIPRVEPFEVIYLDPMFPERKKSALVKKPMRDLKALVGEDDDAEFLLETALQYATHRVVVKRPSGAPTLSTRKPDIQYPGKSTRFDVYLCHPDRS